jgi:hypothetical protein
MRNWPRIKSFVRARRHRADVTKPASTTLGPIKKWGGNLLAFLMWLADLWTIYEECLYLTGQAAPDKAFDPIAVIDIAITLVLIAYAVYAALHATIATAALDRFTAAHHEFDGLLLLLIFAFGWGIYRDFSHFHHQYFDADIDGLLRDQLDTIAAVFLSLGVLKMASHAASAIKYGWHVLQKQRRDASDH